MFIYMSIIHVNWYTLRKFGENHSVMTTFWSCMRMALNDRGCVMNEWMNQRMNGWMNEFLFQILSGVINYWMCKMSSAAISFVIGRENIKLRIWVHLNMCDNLNEWMNGFNWWTRTSLKYYADFYPDAVKNGPISVFYFKSSVSSSIEPVNEWMNEWMNHHIHVSECLFECCACFICSVQVSASVYILRKRVFIWLLPLASTRSKVSPKE